MRCQSTLASLVREQEGRGTFPNCERSDYAWGVEDWESIFQLTSERTTANRISLVLLGGVLHVSLTFNFKLLPVVSHHVPTDMAKHQQLDSDPLPNR